MSVAAARHSRCFPAGIHEEGWRIYLLADPGVPSPFRFRATGDSGGTPRTGSERDQSAPFADAWVNMQSIQELAFFPSTI